MKIMGYAMRFAAGALALGSGGTGAAGPESLPEVVVTGSRVPRIESETLSPVTVITRSQIEATGAATAGELLFTFAANTGGPANVMNGDGMTNLGYAAISLRGAGANATLVLVNGRRAAPYAFSGSAVDLNSIPVAAIDRIEILRDGASALYGADAIAGVVNFILRRDFKGVDMQVGALRTGEGGASSDRLTLSAGGSAGAADRLRGFVTFDFRENAALRATDRSFSRTAYRPQQGYDQTSIVGSPGAYSFDLSSPYVPFSSAGLGCPATLTNGAVLVDDICRHDYVVDSDIIPRGRQASMFGRATLDLGGGATAYTELLFTENDYRYRLSPTPVWGAIVPSGAPFVLPAASPYNPFGTEVQFWWRTVQLGPRTQDVEANGHRVLVGIEGRAGGWGYDFSAGQSGSTSREYFSSGFVSEARLRNVLAAGGRINPFGATANADLGVLHSIETGGLSRTASARMQWLDARGVGEIARWQGRPVSLAAGAEYRRERLEDEATDLLRSGDVIGNVSVTPFVEGKRQASAAYAELLVPVTGTLEAQLGGRADSYSDFGEAVTPKAAFRWQPAPWGALRGSYSRSFRAPSLSELYTEQVRGFGPPSDDPVRCPGGVPQPGADPLTDCGASFGQIGGGNPELQPEKSTYRTVGAVIEPQKGLTAGASWWSLHKNRNVGIVREETSLDPAFYPSLSNLVLRRSPSAADIANGLPGPIDAVLVNNQNLGAVKIEGWDFELALKTPGPLNSQVTAGLLSVWMTRYLQQLYPGGDYVDFLGKSINGTPVQPWRHNAWAQFQRGRWMFSATANYIGRYEDENPNPDGTPAYVASWWTLGLQAAYIRKGWELRAGLQNILDRAPPYSNQTSQFSTGWDNLTHDPRGRAFYLALRYTGR